MSSFVAFKLCYFRFEDSGVGALSVKLTIPDYNATSSLSLSSIESSAANDYVEFRRVFPKISCFMNSSFHPRDYVEFCRVFSKIHVQSCIRLLIQPFYSHCVTVVLIFSHFRSIKRDPPKSLPSLAHRYV